MRITFGDLNDDGILDPNTEIQDANDYYPFGLRMAGENTLVASPGNEYLYNGKELQDELGLGWYDYGARMYAPDEGRWKGVDALGDSFPSWSPYNYVMNSPLVVTDPDGRDTLIMHIAFNSTLSGRYFNVFDISFSLVIGGREFAVKSEENLFMFSNKASDEEGENSLNKDPFYGVRLRRRNSSQNLIEEDPEKNGRAYENEFNIVKINPNGEEGQIGKRGIFIHYGNKSEHFDGCKGLCEFPKEGNIITSREGSISALAKMREIYDQYENQLTGKKFLLEPNSQVESAPMGPLSLTQFQTQVERKRQGINFRFRPSH